MPEGSVTSLADGPLAAYRALRRNGTLTPDPCQELAAEKLQGLHHALKDYHALKHYKGASGVAGWRDRLGLTRRRDPAPQGLYMFGGVGRGKSMLMDLFFDTAPVEPKRRVHFHEFMIEAHDYMHKWRSGAADRRQRRRRKGDDDPIPPLAKHIAEQASLLCFDEFHVTDIADAMILGRLFTALFDHGVVVVATSNWPPDLLYKDGLQRDRFVPFIELMKDRLDILELESGVDYRLERLRGLPVYHCPLTQATARAMQRTFRDLTGDAEGRPDALLLKGRRLEIPRAAKGVAWFPYEDLCAKPLGAGDYLALATHFHTVMVDGVPRFTEDKRNEAKRFITLIDALYEHRTYLVIAAEVPPDRLNGTETHAFEFDRTLSRLMEMQSKDYIALAHLT